jgi:hypothetical protein
MVSAKPGFRVEGIAEIDRPKVTSHLKELEKMGFVLFVPGVGWVDSLPALRCFCVAFELPAGFWDALGITTHGIAPQVLS